MSAHGCATGPSNTGVATVSQSSEQITKLTPIIVVDDVQQSVDFFTATLGFTKTIEVPDEDGLQFAAVLRDGVEIMVQSSDAGDDTFSNEDIAARAGQAFLYLEVGDIELIISATKDADIVKPAHVTDYGAREIYLREPGGNVLGFSQQSTQS